MSEWIKTIWDEYVNLDYVHSIGICSEKSLDFPYLIYIYSKEESVNRRVIDCYETKESAELALKGYMEHLRVINETCND